MEEERVKIILDIPTGRQINYFIMPDGEIGYMVSVDDKVKLIPHRMYKIPISDKNVNMDDYYIFKPIGRIAEKVNIVNVEKGYITCYCYFPVVLENQQLLGYVI